MPSPTRTGPSLAASVATAPASLDHRWFDEWRPRLDLDSDELREMALAKARITRGSARDTWICPIPPHGADTPGGTYSGPERRIPRDRKAWGA